jgi:hypothetical protein
VEQGQLKRTSEKQRYQSPPYLPLRKRSRGSPSDCLRLEAPEDAVQSNLPRPRAGGNDYRLPECLTANPSIQAPTQPERSFARCSNLSFSPS